MVVLFSPKKKFKHIFEHKFVQIAQSFGKTQEKKTLIRENPQPTRLTIYG